jgi:sphinganine-1-phosphate aldolase
MEAEIIRWTLDLYNGDKDSCGIITSGGTESIILACLAYREKALAEKGVTRPNMIMSETAHCAFDKAGFYLGIEIRKVPITKDFMADFEGIKRLIDSNTIALVTSSPEYAYGNYDPAEKLGALAQAYGIGCHSDACLGSYVNPFIKENGYNVAYQYDFKVPGVTSISCDPHKYAYGPKGTSVLMFRDRRLREYQLFVNAVWNGGIYATTCIAGSRPGSVIAGTWASMLKHGKSG